MTDAETKLRETWTRCDYCTAPYPMHCPRCALDACFDLLAAQGGVVAAAAKVAEGFERNVFGRDTSGDVESGWAIKALPYLQALAVLDTARKESA